MFTENLLDSNFCKFLSVSGSSKTIFLLPIFFYVGHSYSPSSSPTPFPNISSAEGKRIDTLCQSVKFFFVLPKIYPEDLGLQRATCCFFLKKKFVWKQSSYSAAFWSYKTLQCEPIHISEALQRTLCFIFYILKSFKAHWLLNAPSGLTLKHCILCTQIVCPFHINLR